MSAISSAISNIVNGSGTSGTAASNLSLKPTDFLNMMVTELKNQDPMKPEDNSQLLQQMSQIGQLQSTTDLETSVSSMTQQNQVAAASGLIGKTVSGTDANKNVISGTVQSVNVFQNAATLNLQDGQSLSLANLSTISGTAAAAGSAGAATGTDSTTAAN